MFDRFLNLAAAAVLVVATLPGMTTFALAQGAPPPAAPPAAGAPAPAPQPGVAVRVRGTINSLMGNVLNVTTREGETININLAPDYRVNAAIPMTLADITNNSYIGIVGEQDAAGNIVALDVRIFPEANRGAGAGQRPWDLTPTSTMTNATVAAVTPEQQSVVVRVTFPDGERLVTVTPETPIWTTEPADATLLVAGAYIVINSRKLDDGTYTATSIMVEKDGTKPTL